MSLVKCFLSSLLLFLCAIVVSPLTPDVYAGEKGDVVLRFRSLLMNPSESGDISVIGGTPNLDTSVALEFDATYFFSDHLAAELIFLGGAKHNPKAIDTALGDLELGSVIASPAGLTFQYHFTSGRDAVVQPYVGAGVTYAIFSNKKASEVITDIQYKNKFGYQFQAGFDVPIGQKFTLNFDYKKLFVKTEIAVNDGLIGANVTLNPSVYGVGLGYCF